MPYKAAIAILLFAWCASASAQEQTDRSKGSFGGGGASYATCIYCPDAKYTKKARAAKLEGTVQLKVVVGLDGTASDIEIVKGLGQGLDEEAVKAVRMWRFKPAVGPNGDPVATVTPIEITFHLK